MDKLSKISLSSILKVAYVLVIISLIFRLVQNFFVYMLPEALNNSADFQWDTVKLFSKRLNPYKETLFGIYDEGKLYTALYGGITSNQFPSIICLLLPYIIFDAYEAKIAWLISNIFFSAMAVFCLNKTVFKDSKWLNKVFWNVLWLGSAPMIVTIGVGQHLLFSFSFFMLSVFLSEWAEAKAEKGNCLWIMSGIALGTSFFKYTVIFVVIFYFIWKRWFRPILIASLMHLLLTIFSAVWLRVGIADMLKDSLMISKSTGMGGSIDLMNILGGGGVI